MYEKTYHIGSKSARTKILHLGSHNIDVSIFFYYKNRFSVSILKLISQLVEENQM